MRITSGRVGGDAVVTAVGIDIRAHPEGRIWCTSSLHDDIGALSDSKCYDISRVWLDRHKVIGHDCHVVTVDGETLKTF